MYQVPHFIGGEKIFSGTQTEDIHNPATGDIIGKVCLADKTTVDQAVLAAKSAFPAWSETTPLKRARFLFQYKILLEKNLDELAAIVTREHGKILNDARASVQRGIDVVDFALGIPNHLKGSYSENVATDVDSYSVRQPLGVCVGITPFNFPAMVPLWMFPMAIACGNTFILKPSEKDPSCAVRLAELAQEAGIPNGVINIVQGQKDAVNSLLTHPDVKAISFVGSTPIAEYVYRTGTAHGKRVQAFGGAKNHAVIMPDADIDQAVDAIIGAAYGSAGERCMAISVVITVGDAVANELVDRLKPRVANLKIGPGVDENSEMGPLVTQPHWDRVKSYIDLGIKEGASLVVDGRTIKKEKGYYMGGCLFDHVQPEMKIYQEEIFGPVLSIVRVPDFQAALDLVNAHEYGNGTAIFTRDGNTARTFATKVQVGMVGINIPIPVPVAYHSFGGWKRSIFGDIHMHGPEAIQFYTKLKTITQRWLKNPKGTEFTLPTHH
ncbi:MAG TPA: CoA-acylating methylmalonate-semialdehyde dehydrogenase [Gammaproteobacteria bacterium]|jgi:malonate-semialdehyde dehydrogenase (acetylating)/methylmalonate-semialdehyde dehydrogenase|nr:CoA-acylating methylmalonate-semialdehyde dehydrogenase [Gammaproteobacteria bacterium]